MGVRHKLEDLKRFQQIAKVLSAHGFGILVDKVRSGGSALSSKPHIRVRKAMEELGGAFVKLGQMLALRPDLLPPEFCKELEKLQDRGKPVSYPEIKKILDKELRRPQETLFSKIETKPLAVGSIAQVHKGYLTNGKPVAIKVLKPHTKEIFREDADLLGFLATKIKRYVASDVINPEVIIKEFKKYTKKELDFSYEKDHLKHFASCDCDVTIPRVYDTSTSEVLIMDFIEGASLSKTELSKKTKAQRKLLAKTVATSIMKQVFIHGYFHADPHPGNFLLQKNNKLALIDFGIVGTVDTKTKVTLTVILYALINKDVHLLSRSLLKLGFAKEHVNQEEFEYDLRETLHKYYSAKLSDINLSVLFLESIEVVRKHQLEVPQKFMLLGKSLVTTESVCHVLDPDFRFVAVAKPFLKVQLPKLISSKFMLSQAKKEIMDYGELVLNMPKDMKKLLEIKEDDHRAIQKLQGSLTDMQKEFIRLQKQLITSVIGVLLIIIAVVINEGPAIALGLSATSSILFSLGSLMLIGLLHIGHK